MQPYPFPNLPVAGTVQLRQFPLGNTMSTDCDLGAVGALLGDAGAMLVFAGEYPDTLRSNAGVARDNAVLTRGTSLLALTAAVYEAWASGSANVGVLIENIGRVVTGIGGDINADTFASWAAAVAAGDISQLQRTVGLDYRIHTGAGRVPAGVRATVVACQIISGVDWEQGPHPLERMAAAVVEIEQIDVDDEVVTATATCSFPTNPEKVAVETVTLTRPTRSNVGIGRRWEVAVPAAV